MTLISPEQLLRQVQADQLCAPKADINEIAERRRSFNECLEGWVRSETTRGDVPRLVVRNAWASRSASALLEASTRIRGAMSPEEAVVQARVVAKKVRQFNLLGSLPPGIEVRYEKTKGLECAACRTHDGHSFQVRLIPEHLVASGHGRIVLVLVED